MNFNDDDAGCTEISDGPHAARGPRVSGTCLIRMRRDGFG